MKKMGNLRSYPLKEDMTVKIQRTIFKTCIGCFIATFLSACADSSSIVDLYNPVTKQAVQCGFVTAGGQAWTDGCVKAYMDSGYAVVTDTKPAK